LERNQFVANSLIFTFQLKHMGKIIASILLMLICFLGIARSQDNIAELEAFKEARNQNLPIFLVFSGSDWCVPCIRFEKEVLSDSNFIRFAKENLVILKAEFPQKKRLEPNIVKRNELLAEKYNPSGLFPHLVLLEPDGSVIATIKSSRQSPEEYILEMNKAIIGTPSLGKRLHPMGGDSIPSHETPSLKEFTAKTLLMGCAFELTIIDSAGSDRGWQLIQECIDEVKRIEQLISEWSDTTEIGRLNSLAGAAPVILSPEVYELIQRTVAISEMTQGAFDITFGGAGKLWKFDPEDMIVPDPPEVNKALRSVGYQYIQLQDNNKVFLSQPGMQIGFGGIGKGYAAESVKKKMLGYGITGGVINASGDLTAWGTDAGGNPWKVGIADPENPSKVLLWLPVEDGAVATSGNYEKYVMIDGERYGHILDPRTGYPVKGVKSVTVISPNAELSDALATAVFVMGVETGLDFIGQLPDTHCIIVDDMNRIHYSEGIDLN
jgi:thiamine biosynthesis lipoprotein